METKLDANNQHALTKFGFTAERPENGEGPARVSADDAAELPGVSGRGGVSRELRAETFLETA